MLTLISGATIVNEDRKLCGSLLIEDDRIAEIYEGGVEAGKAGGSEDASLKASTCL